MMRAALQWLGFFAMLACPALSAAADASATADRLTLMVAGSTLSHSDDGGGAAVGWLHNFNADTVLGAAVDYQTIADSHWTFGSLTLVQGFGPAVRRANLYAEAHVGSGRDDVHSYDYSIFAAGLFQNLTRQLSVQLEDRQIDIDTTHGNLPKIGLQYLWSPSLSSALSYSHSVSGDLGTRLAVLRIDRYSKAVNLIVGGATGKASPAVLDLQTGITTPGLTLHEYFAGVGRTFSRADVTLLADYLKLADTERVTLTLNCTVRLGRAGAAR